LNITLLRKLVVGAVAAHSLILGAAMLLFPLWTLRLSGWHYEGNTFFPSQSGVFLFLLGSLYLAAARHTQLGWFIVASKTVAVVFLITQSVLNELPPMILLAAVLDGLMGGAVAAALVWETQAQSPEAAIEQS